MTVATAGVPHDAVVRYYDYTLPFYRWFWHGKTRAIHYGIWGEDAATHADALLATNKILVQRGRITAADTALDAGCGVGGSALWVARETGARVTGITVSARQAKKAMQLARRAGLADKTTFLVRDYFHTGFEDGSFSVAWGIESLCYAHARVHELTTELYRVLAPGGRLVVMDGFRGSETARSREEEARLRVFENGFVLPRLVTPEAFADALRAAGFRDIQVTDITGRILPTARRMRRLCLFTYPLTRILTALGLVPRLLLENQRTGLVQERLFEDHALVYVIITAQK